MNESENKSIDIIMLELSKLIETAEESRWDGSAGLSTIYVIDKCRNINKMLARLQAGE